MWQLQKEENDKRFYSNPLTGGKCEMDLLNIDKDGNKWWGFSDLLAMPFTRHMATTKIMSLSALGFTKDDIFGIITGLKNLLNSSDAEKFQKSYALILDFESKALTATDTVGQLSALTCVYYTFNDEAIDSFEDAIQAKKMSILKVNSELQAFFLKRQTELIESYMTRLNEISKIVLAPLPEV